MAKPNYDPFSSFFSSHSASGSSTPANISLSLSQLASKPPQTPSDPFAALSSPAIRQPSPLPTPSQSQAPPPSTSLFDFAAHNPSTPQPSAATSQASNGGSAEDDWNFSSALPEDSNLPLSNDFPVSNTSVKIMFKASRSDDSIISIHAHFSNNTPSLVTEYTFQVAVTKVRQILHVI